ncbi:alpha/beta hydrolase-fold protein [Brevundimonas sp. A19_0]|uniref:alpha/beta hydrolase n=1 Tax=Brevundimonas sp. A19_0 TaxID=2821087 RepID=UPI001ADBE8D6|nr:alpha/beta hydrolase-fold protein [Brevundimonas sp. A19_0]MBO9502341.1 alpha/beta hydrolase [Brevundimonas sp. A19_0]
MRGLVSILFGLLLLATAPHVRAQHVPDMPFPAALHGDAFRLDSPTLGRGFDIYVRLPPEYDPEGPAYPVVYLLDGDSLFPILAANHLFLTYEEDLPEVVIVGIAYGGFDPSVNRRNIDFQSPDEGVPPEDAGAGRFHTFLTDELIPVVEARFNVDPDGRVLFGQSRAGNLVLYSAVAHPDVFRGRIASNPSLTPGMGSILDGAAPARRDDLMVVITSGERDRADLPAEAALWVDTWSGRDVPDRPWDIRLIRIPGGTHAANSTDAYRAGMLWLFAGDYAGD